MDNTTNKNIAETLALVMKEPSLIIEIGDMAPHRATIALPPGWTTKDVDTTKDQPTPVRKVASVVLQDAESFVGYIERHGSLETTTVWCEADYPKGKIDLTAIINDHGETEDEPAWRDHLARFTPEFSEEWRIWNKHNGTQMSQLEFAFFLERNLKDIASAEGFPTGTQMLSMATDLEINQDSRFKSQTKLQSGGVRLEYIEDADEATTRQMEVFKQFAIGLQVFRNGQGYQLTARLRYRKQDSKLVFWYELVRPDVTLEDAGRDLLADLRTKISNPFFFGKAFC